MLAGFFKIIIPAGRHTAFLTCWGFFYFFFLLSLLSSGLSHNVLFWFQVKCLCGYGWYFKMDDDSVIYTAVVLCGGILGTDRETAAFNK